MSDGELRETFTFDDGLEGRIVVQTPDDNKAHLDTVDAAVDFAKMIINNPGNVASIKLEHESTDGTVSGSATFTKLKA